MKSAWARGVATGCMGLGLLWGVLEAQAASGDADGTYSVTITLVEISKDGGATYTTLFTGSKVINIASVGAGAAAASLASGASLLPGTYNQIRVTLGSTLNIKGFVNNGAGTGTLYTNNDADGFDLNTSGINTAGSDYAVSTLTIPEANRVNTIAISITVPSEGSPPTTRINFDTRGVLTVSGNTPSLGAPNVTIT